MIQLGQINPDIISRQVSAWELIDAYTQRSQVRTPLRTDGVMSIASPEDARRERAALMARLEAHEARKEQGSAHGSSQQSSSSERQ